VADLQQRHPWLPASTTTRLARAYGTRTDLLLEGATCLADLGMCYGADLTEAELRYLVAHEWVTRASDVVWRRSKLGLRLSPVQIEAIDTALLRLAQPAVLS
jgi:glycerol-3-phosphate dehydrogenase